MPLRIRVSGPARADELLAYLRGLGADAQRQGDAVTVCPSAAPMQGEPASQDRIELEFLLRTAHSFEWIRRLRIAAERLALPAFTR
jgi:hypothetical protein